LSNETYGDSEESELRTLDSRYGAVLESFERGSDRFRGDDERNQGDDERNIHDWLGRNDRVVSADYPIGEVFLLPVVTQLYWQYNRGDGIFRKEHLETSSQDWSTYGRMRILKLTDPVCRELVHPSVAFIVLFLHSFFRHIGSRDPAL